MQLHNTTVLLAPTDLTARLSSARLTVLKRAVARGEIKKPWSREDPHLTLIHQHGFDHEQDYLDQLNAQHGAGPITEIAEVERPDEDLRGVNKRPSKHSTVRALPKVCR